MKSEKALNAAISTDAGAGQLLFHVLYDALGRFAAVGAL